MATPSLFPMFLKAQSGGGGIDLSGATIIAAADVRVAVVSEYEAEVENDEIAATVEGEITATVEGEVTAEVECP